MIFCLVYWHHNDMVNPIPHVSATLLLAKILICWAAHVSMSSDGGLIIGPKQEVCVCQSPIHCQELVSGGTKMARVLSVFCL